jgi:hypothetical protein
MSHSVLYQGTDIPGVYNVMFKVHVLMFSHITFQIDEHLGIFQSMSFEPVVLPSPSLRLVMMSIEQMAPPFHVVTNILWW